MDEKAQELIYRGIHYMRISLMHDEQKEPFIGWLPQDQIIKIQVENEIFIDCVQYHHYEHWFDNIMKSQKEIESEPSEKFGISIQ